MIDEYDLADAAIIEEELSEDELLALEKEKALAEEEAKKEAEKEKVGAGDSDEIDIVKEEILDTASKDKYGSEYKDLTTVQQADIVKDPSTTISQQTLTDAGIYLPADTTSIGEIIEILEKREIKKAFQATTFNLSYQIEKIPEPSINKIYSLLSPNSVIFDKPVSVISEETGESELVTNLNNFINQYGGSQKLIIGGDNGTNYELVVYDSTNTKYYDPSTNEWTHGYSSFQGQVENFKDEITFDIPSVSVETIYKVYFKDSNAFVGSAKTNKSLRLANYDDSLPTETQPWQITQLPNTTTTVKLKEIVGGTKYGSVSGDLTITHPPGSMLNHSENTQGKYTVSLTVNKGRSKNLSISSAVPNGIIDFSHINSFGNDVYTTTEIKDIDLTATVDSNGNGKVNGTITIGKTGLRASTVEILTNRIFATDRRDDFHNIS